MDWRGTIMDMGIGGETGSHPPHCKNMNTNKTEWNMKRNMVWRSRKIERKILNTERQKRRSMQVWESGHPCHNAAGSKFVHSTPHSPHSYTHRDRKASSYKPIRRRMNKRIQIFPITPPRYPITFTVTHYPLVDHLHHYIFAPIVPSLLLSQHHSDLQSNFQFVSFMKVRKESRTKKRKSRTYRQVWIYE